MKSNLLKLLFCSIASILFTLFFILFLINLTNIGLEFYPAFDKFYYIIYLLCILIVDTLFIFKTIDCSTKFYVASKSDEFKEQHAQTKTKRAVETKQAKIKALEAELEALKND